MTRNAAQRRSWTFYEAIISIQMKETTSHIHVATPDGECKFWIQPIRLARNKGVKPLNLASEK